jgi:eukaryotic-like serine/threonine-protein kinase
MHEGPVAPARIIGRYALYGELAAGGMASVHLGRLLGPVGFSRTVAIKRLHEQYARDPEFVSMFLDEARLCARIRHPNVVPTLDVIANDRQLLLVMEYVQGESLSRLCRATFARGQRIPVPIAVAITSGILHGLHAAHEAKDEKGQPLGIVHRDVSPQNVLVGSDGVARVLDFGVAKAKGRLHTTQDGRVKGKLSYMAPEQLRSDPVDRKSDVFAAAIVTWELLAGRRLFEAENEGATITKLLFEPIRAPSSFLNRPLPKDVPWPALDAIIMRGLERDANKRFATARDMANELEAAVLPASAAQVGAWVETVAGEVLTARSARVQEIESSSSDVGQNMSEIITKLASDADVTKTQERSSSKILESIPAPSSTELLSKADMPVSTSGLQVTHKDRWRRLAAFMVVAAALVGIISVARSGREGPTGSPASFPIASGVATSPSPTTDTTHALPFSSAPTVSPTNSGTALPTASAANSPAEALATPLAADATVPALETTASKASPSPPSTTVPSTPSTSKVKPAKSSVDCRNPYTRDSLGRKIYKIECL